MSSDPPSSGHRVVAPRDPTRRRRILDAAKRHFTERGFKGTRLDAIAAEVGCAKGALYLEFESKEILLREVVAELFGMIRSRYEAEVARLESPLERLKATLRFVYRLMGEEPLFERLLRDDPELRALRPPEEAATEQRAARAEVDSLLRWVDEGVARGEIRADIDRDAVPFVLSALRFVPLHLRLATAGMFPGERALDAIVDIFAAGLAARAAPGAPRPVPAAPIERAAAQQEPQGQTPRQQKPRQQKPRQQKPRQQKPQT
ncbi:TetR/AcrR family transcriptional regulator [Sorangium sp. So ce131]|uniref:TetR/AcrR family transcriptional regulator n=1 Tax=Sorangium sp. So ce131 TaxID=3133282 RepID=UPI003F60680E